MDLDTALNLIKPRADGSHHAPHTTVVAEAIVSQSGQDVKYLALLGQRYEQSHSMACELKSVQVNAAEGA
ncbi:uncharacterized protein FFE2_08586 [Fusarium fujikuroi]|uniref:Uncharacterized protein n=1 Tax=Fusarium fujikuroi TaxID=5127 RepID=A0A9Q9RX41_FUSFU|nr:uncharacterized protein FFE2_08586 [Fusarium fujikuroi]VTT74597.1 unnamed protein product [Fusarium fujikuroi]